MLGAIFSKPMLEALDQYCNGQCLPHNGKLFSYVKEVVPFKWCKSLEHVPEQIKSELEYSLVMLKTHRASDQMIPEIEMDTFWFDVGCYSSGTQKGFNVSPVILLAK